MGAPRSGAAAGTLDRLADPRRARRRQDQSRRRGGPAMVVRLPVRQPDRADRGRRARRDGAGRIGRAQLLPQGRAAALSRLRRPARMAERRVEPSVLRRRARPAAGKAAHEAVARRTGGVAAAGRLRSGDARPAPRRQAADGRHHHARARRRSSSSSPPTRTRSSPAARLSTTAAIWRAPFSSASPSATRAASSDGRSCSPRSSKRRRALYGRAR